MPTPPRNPTGRQGEQIARNYLEKHLNWKILDTNWRYQNLEVDIIAEDPSSHSIVFVEVKTTSGRRFIPEERISFSKESALVRAAEKWIQQHPEYQNPSREIRFDVIAVHLFRHDRYKVFHIRDAFYPVGGDPPP